MATPIGILIVSFVIWCIAAACYVEALREIGEAEKLYREASRTFRRVTEMLEESNRQIPCDIVPGEGK